MLLGSALVLAFATTLFEPVASPTRQVVFDAAGTPWMVVDCRLSLGARPVRLLWPQADAGVDLASARVIGVKPEGAAAVVAREQTADAVEWVLAAPSGDRGAKKDTAASSSATSAGATADVDLTLAAKLSGLSVAWQYLVTAGRDKADWSCAVTVSGWKGAPLDNVAIVTGGGRIDGVSLRADTSQTLQQWSEAAVPFTQSIRWDSASNRQPATRYLEFARPADTSFGKRSMAAGNILLQVGTVRSTVSFGGAGKGSAVEVAAGDAAGILVKRTKAASTQVNVRTDVNRRLAAYDERLDYEYVARNGTDQPVEVTLYEHPARGWEVTACSVPWSKANVDTVAMTVKLAAGSQQTVTLTALRRDLTPQ